MTESINTRLTVNDSKPGARSTDIKRASKGQLLDSGKRHCFYQTAGEKEQESKEILMNRILPKISDIFKNRILPKKLAIKHNCQKNGEGRRESSF